MALAGSPRLYRPKSRGPSHLAPLPRSTSSSSRESPNSSNRSSPSNSPTISPRKQQLSQQEELDAFDRILESRDSLLNDESAASSPPSPTPRGQNGRRRSLGCSRSFMSAQASSRTPGLREKSDSESFHSSQRSFAASSDRDDSAARSRGKQTFSRPRILSSMLNAKIAESSAAIAAHGYGYTESPPSAEPVEGGGFREANQLIPALLPGRSHAMHIRRGASATSKSMLHAAAFLEIHGGSPPEAQPPF